MFKSFGKRELSVCFYIPFLLIESESGCSCLQWDSGKEHSLGICRATAFLKNRYLESHTSVAAGAQYLVSRSQICACWKNPARALLTVQRLKKSQDPLKATCCLTDRKRDGSARPRQRRWEYLGLWTYSKAHLFSCSLKMPAGFWGSNIWLCVL